MGFWERLRRGVSTGHGDGHHGGSHSRGHGGGHGGHRENRGGTYQPEPPLPQAFPAPARSELRCTQCGVQGAPGARFCGACGGQLVANSCQGCGTLLAAGAKYCSQCGKPSA